MIFQTTKLSKHYQWYFMWPNVPNINSDISNEKNFPNIISDISNDQTFQTLSVIFQMPALSKHYQWYFKWPDSPTIIGDISNEQSVQILSVIFQTTKLSKRYKWYFK